MLIEKYNINIKKDQIEIAKFRIAMIYVIYETYAIIYIYIYIYIIIIIINCNTPISIKIGLLIA